MKRLIFILSLFFLCNFASAQLDAGTLNLSIQNSALDSIVLTAEWHKYIHDRGLREYEINTQEEAYKFIFNYVENFIDGINVENPDAMLLTANINVVYLNGQIPIVLEYLTPRIFIKEKKIICFNKNADNCY